MSAGDCVSSALEIHFEAGLRQKQNLTICWHVISKQRVHTGALGSHRVGLRRQLDSCGSLSMFHSMEYHLLTLVCLTLVSFLLKSILMLLSCFQFMKTLQDLLLAGFARCTLYSLALYHTSLVPLWLTYHMLTVDWQVNLVTHFGLAMFLPHKTDLMLFCCLMLRRLCYL